MSKTSHLLPVSARIPAGKKQEYVEQAIRAGLSVGEYVAMILTNYDLDLGSQKPVEPPKAKAKATDPPEDSKKLKEAEERAKKAEAKLQEQAQEIARLKKVETLMKDTERAFFSGRTSQMREQYRDLKQKLGFRRDRPI